MRLWRREKSKDTVGNLKTQKNWWCSSCSSLKAEDQCFLQTSQTEKSNSFSLSLFILIRLSTVWMRPTYIEEGNLFYSVYWFECWKGWLLSRVRLFCDPMECSPPGSSVHGILQARTLEWLDFSRKSCWPRDWTQVSCIAGRFFTV